MDSGHQNVVVMRHGDRIDNFEPLWTEKAARPWDPPLVLDGKVRAFCTGKKFNKTLGFPIHRVFVSPFLRCLETASEVIHALCANDDSVTHMSSADCLAIDPSKLKLPKWEESIQGARDRYKNIIKILADKYPTENLLLVTHGEGVGVSVTANTPEDVMVIEVEYCAYSPLKRTISKNKDGSLTFGEFKVSQDQGHTGISTTRPTTA